MEGYHSRHKKEQSDQTVTASSEKGGTSPSSPDLTPGPSSMLRYLTNSPFTLLTLEMIQDLVLRPSMDPARLHRRSITLVFLFPLFAQLQSRPQTRRRKINPPLPSPVIPDIYPAL